MEEIWKDIVITKGGVTYNYSGIYQVSNLGRVKNVKRNKILQPDKNTNGYLKISLHKNGERCTFFVHRIVATAFIPNPNNLPEVNHLNEIRTDNRVENLQWCTSKENTTYSQGKKVRCIETKQVFNSASEASDWHQQKTGKSRIAGSIVQCCKKKSGYKTAGGYHWEYVD